jgi:amino acid transporter
LSEKKLFVRKATGLVREIGPLTAILIVMCNTVGLGWQKRAFQWTAPAIVPENTYVAGVPPIVMSFILVGIVVLLTVWTFAILGAAMPRSGGGYVYISRIISPPVGFLATWVEFFSIAVSYGQIGVAVFEAILIYTRISGLSAAALASTEVLFLGGVVLVVIFAVVASFGVRLTGALLNVIFWIPAALTIVIYGVMLTASPQSVTAGVQALSSVTPDFVVQKALGAGMATSFKGNYWDAVNITNLGAYWAYIGFAASTFVAGEIKEASKTLPRTLFTANFFIIILYISMSLLAFRAASSVGLVHTAQGDFSFFSAYAFLSYPNQLGSLGINLPQAWSPNMAGFAAIGGGMSWITLLIPMFAALWVMNDIPPFILTSSRILFAMAFDRVLPESLANVNERLHSPVNAVIATMVVAFIGCFAESDILVKYLGSSNIIAAYINSGGAVLATDIWDTIFFLFSALAGAMFIFRKKTKAIYDASAYKPKLAGFPAIAVIGILATIGNIWLIYADFQASATFYEAWYLTLLLLVVGGLLYWYYHMRGSRKGVDYSTIYAQIPPE